jgi:hypothetical protein
MSARQIFQQCGLEDYIGLVASQVQDIDYIRDRAADWSPTAAFPGALLREWSSTQRAQDVKVQPYYPHCVIKF